MNEPFYTKDTTYLSIDKWNRTNPNLKVGFTTRNDGVSGTPYHSLNLGLHVQDSLEDVLVNRSLLADKIGVELDNWVSGQQIHDAVIQTVTLGNRGNGAKSYHTSIPGVDGLITNEVGVLCTAFYADCVPLFFYDPISGYVGIAHAGWKGTVKGIARKMVEEFKRQGVKLKNLEVVIGPSISKDNYEVDENVFQHIDEKYMNTVEAVGNNHYLLDLKQLNVEILLQAGILRNNIEVTNYCTFNDESLFFSHRRDNGSTGRMLGFIGYSE